MLIITPHSARGTRTPRPMNERPAASRIAQPHCSVDTTMIGTRVLGSRCRQRRRKRVFPTATAASAYSLSFAVSIRFGIRRAYPGTLIALVPTITVETPGPSAHAIAIANTKRGNACRTSCVRMIVRSEEHTSELQSHHDLV